MELFSLSFGDLWKDWEVRFLVILSLILQIVLITFGKQRKFTSKRWIRIVLWCAYLMADSVATFALGVISKTLGDVNDGKDKFLLEITAFWAPFLLLHLGGPDTITAYSLEDNELWLRHFLALVVQTGVVIYIWIIAGTGPQFFILSILIFFPGIIKYGERTWVLWSASNEQLRGSLLPYPNCYKFMLEYILKRSGGYQVTIEEVLGIQELNLPLIENERIPDGVELVAAYDLLQSFKCLFVDLILGSEDRNYSQFLFKEISSEKAFKVIEMELGFMYDVLYTKATIIHSSYGWVLRIVSLSFTSITLVLFSVPVIDKQNYSTIDLVLTFLLLIVAVLLEVYAFFLLLSSDWTGLWLTEHRNTCIGQAINFIQRPEQPRWSNSMSQFNLLSFSLKDKQTICYGIQKLLRIDKKLDNNRYTTCVEVTVGLKKLIFEHVKEKFDDLKRSSDDENVLRTLCSFGAGKVLKNFEHNELDWSIQGQFDKSILIWHIATDICNHWDWKGQETVMLNVRFSIWLSQYMLYLLVICPSMLPMEIGMISFQDTYQKKKKFQETCTAVTQFFEFDMLMADTAVHSGANCFLSGDPTFNKLQACEILSEFPPVKEIGDSGKTVFNDARRLASELQAVKDKEQKWKMITSFWLEMLAYAACHCRGNYHAKQLSQGGELLTHVWLLRAHFGLTEQCNNVAAEF